MFNGTASNSSFPNPTGIRARVTSFDSAYEHSLNRYVDVKLLLQEANTESSDTPATFASAS
jgi:hypothetical protein